MRPIADMPDDVAAGIRVLFTDIDDTITTEGRLHAAAYQALEDLHEAGIAVAPITGRPAGWCDMVARFWPVAGVVGENGAFYYAYDHAARKMIRKAHPAVEAHLADPARFDRIRDRVAREVPGAAISADQPFRLADLAIDFCEDVEPLAPADVARIKAIFEEEGAVAKVSSIHVNGWFGDYDKLTMSRTFATDILGLDIDARNSVVAFVGDSPNDQPMFGFFDNSCGVANVRDFEAQISTPPKWVASHKGGAGFREIADYILAARRGALARGQGT
ncbi:HAD family hydrolase [Zhengella mangrovi]|uniref:HAD family hydrolase n=1 Tax=Zhengella mangrovi TaxID=1982044 RepID=A0A2G1QUQ1_9HYPH|nr:HAD-IIB family hydrolase [Zhengella mangrovi]PHP68928.1 HAD family hydrolase [Zhengella mangrovi]